MALNKFLTGSQSLVSTGAPATPTTGTSAAGTLAATTYYVVTTYVTANGESLPSAQATQAAAINTVLTVTSPAATTNPVATGWNVYVGTTNGSGWTKQNSAPIAIGTGYTEPTTGLVVGAAVPSVDNSGLTTVTLYTPSAALAVPGITPVFEITDIMATSTSASFALVQLSIGGTVVFQEHVNNASPLKFNAFGTPYTANPGQAVALVFPSGSSTTIAYNVSGLQN